MSARKLALTVICLLPSFPVAAHAATISVTTNADVSASECTLRDAIGAANGNSPKGACPAGEASGTDLIDFALPAPSTITVATALPTILSNLTIKGPGSSSLTVSGGNATNIFRIEGGSVTISGLTIANGACIVGCALNNTADLLLEGVVVEHNVATVNGGADAFPGPGGIRNGGGSMTIRNSTIRANETLALNATNQNAPQGGGMVNAGSALLTIEGSTIAGNLVSATAAGAGTTNASGGGIANFGELVIRRSTLSANAATAAGSNTFNSAQGGGISNANSPNVKVTIAGSTIAGNSASASGPGEVDAQSGGFSVFGSAFTVRGSTIAGNSAPINANVAGGSGATFTSTIVSNPLGGGKNCGAGVLSGGFNIESANTCGFNAPTDQVSTNPLLDPAGLADNGGPTQTIGLQHGSPAIDRGLAGLGETADQRGRTRPVEVAEVPNAAGGDGTDVGAYEVQLPDTQITDGPAEGATVSAATQTFGFKADEPGATFECSLDAGAFGACTSPDTLNGLAAGSHTFRVRAVGSLGYADSTPATRTFTVKPPAPQTRLARVPAKTFSHRLTFRFSSSQPGSSFRCKLDRAKWRRCASPRRTPFLKLGKHRFWVRAISAQGIPDPTPATKTFRVLPRP
jgi:hypothetical protein